jgi:hypothetical protein
MGLRRAGSLPLRGGQHDGGDNADDHDEQYGTCNKSAQTNEQSWNSSPAVFEGIANLGSAKGQRMHCSGSLPKMLPGQSTPRSTFRQTGTRIYLQNRDQRTINLLS